MSPCTSCGLPTASFARRADGTGGLLGLAPGGVCRAVAVTSDAVRSYRTPFTLAFEPKLEWAVCFLWHFPSRCRAQPLAGALPCGVRTFLGALESAPRPSSGLQSFSGRAQEPGSAIRSICPRAHTRVRPYEFPAGSGTPLGGKKGHRRRSAKKGSGIRFGEKQAHCRAALRLPVYLLFHQLIRRLVLVAGDVADIEAEGLPLF
jgi:hypothetical protein